MSEPDIPQSGSEVLFALGSTVFAVAAQSVVKVIAMPPVVPLPFLPAGIDGVVAISGKIVPLLTLPETAREGRELILVRLDGDDYGLCADRVLRMTANDAAIPAAASSRFIDIADLVAGIGSTEAIVPGVSTFDIEPRVASGDGLAETPPAALAGQSAALAVETATAIYRLPLARVVELRDSLPTIALPDPRRFFSGAAFCGETLLPIICLGALRDGSRADDEPSNAFVVVEAAGRRCVLAVKNVVGIAQAAGPGEVLDLAALLAEVLPESGADAPAPSTLVAETQTAGAQYLLVEYAGQSCAFALDSIARIHAPQPLLRVPSTSATISIAGVAAIGGRILPVLDLGAQFGLAAETREQSSLLELKSGQGETFAVAVDRILGLVLLTQDELVGAPEGTAIIALAKIDAKTVWVLAPPAIAEQAGWRSHAA